jgi:hypothetical protein
MEKIINSNKKIGVVWIFLFLITFVNASGVATPYWDENPLMMYPGESVIIELVLQNMAGEPEDIILKAKISSERDIASLIEEEREYLVPFGRDDIKVPIEIKIPENIEGGGIMEIFVSFTKVEDSTEGMVNVVPSTTSKIVVEIVGVEESTFYQQPAPKEEINYLTWIIGLIILGLIITWIIKKRKGKKFHYNPKDDKHFQKHP